MKLKNSRVLILSGGRVSISFVKKYLEKEKFEYIIAVDSGLLLAQKLGLPVNLIVGDFDSVPAKTLDSYKNNPNKEYRIEKYNPQKDYTDTQIAIEKAVERSPKEIVILGGTGTRFDHSISNIQNLLLPLEEGIKAFIIDEHNKIYLTNKDTKINKKDLFGPYISLLPLTKVVEKISLIGFKYTLDKDNIYIGNSIGVSNEMIEEEGKILLESGILIIIESRD